MSVEGGLHFQIDQVRSKCFEAEVWSKVGAGSLCCAPLDLAGDGVASRSRARFDGVGW